MDREAHPAVVIDQQRRHHLSRHQRRDQRGRPEPGREHDRANTSRVRPPFGGRRPGALRIARSLGLQPVMWNVSCYDWKPISAEEIASRAERQIRGGNVILLHDGEFHRVGVDRSRSIEATERILSRYKGEGYEFVTVPEMMKAATSN